MLCLCCLLSSGSGWWWIKLREAQRSSSPVFLGLVWTQRAQPLVNQPGSWATQVQFPALTGPALDSALARALARAPASAPLLQKGLLPLKCSGSVWAVPWQRLEPEIPEMVFLTANHGCVYFCAEIIPIDSGICWSLLPNMQKQTCFCWSELKLFVAACRADIQCFVGVF